MKIPQISDIRQASDRIKPFINRTPILTSQSLNEMFGCRLFFKCENFQKVGAFKFRGATNSVLLLSEDDAKKGVATHSSGNHAQALALAARMRGIPATIVMPDNSPDVKKDAVAGYGAKIVFCEPTLKAREDNLQKVIDETGAAFIHPYNNFNVISGQGTAALEIIEEIGSPDYLLVPVGGGGLLSGSLISTKSISNQTKVIACEPKNADDAYRSFKSGTLVPSVNPNTIADGLLTSLSDLTFEIVMKYLDDIYTVSEDSIISSMRLIWERMKIIVEPSSAVILAVVSENQEFFKGKTVALILSGGNVDMAKLPWQG